MAYKKLIFIFIFLTITSCYHPSFSSFFDIKKTIEIGNFSEKINLPRRSVAFDFKRYIEDYIMKRNPSNLVFKDGDAVLEGIFLNYTITSMKNCPFKKIQITAKIYYRDNFEPEKNWEECFVISEDFSHKKDLFLEKPIDRIIEKLTVQVYHKIFNENNIRIEK
ncbi:hypothetical protein BLBBGE_205 [Blattabacterium sp. (Blattella germanica) str. Bge]|uniref:hypothetical protein n=1 Tax=Blattabacterium sp. (Blattella germanica) TaxID=624186 RepID=UPI0001BB6119|nr:hypothetical protein [Blattabacterium sp. (Blattella germanica)]ACY40227.1 hypothetical protein BLBBGE_205 [Blattabacterium sp. (Blattella germanica) str. Bge]